MADNKKEDKEEKGEEDNHWPLCVQCDYCTKEFLAMNIEPVLYRGLLFCSWGCRDKHFFWDDVTGGEDELVDQQPRDGVPPLLDEKGEEEEKEEEEEGME